jgi:hypothetical protein
MARCGVLAHGFLRLHCDACGRDRLLAFSCKGRAVCPSCGGRRMAGTAAHLVDRMIPEVPVRQWVLTLPYPLRYRCAWDARLTSEMLRAFLRALFADQRCRARLHDTDLPAKSDAQVREKFLRGAARPGMLRGLLGLSWWKRETAGRSPRWGRKYSET